MPRFLQLSNMLINVDAIRFILPGMVKPRSGGQETEGCTVFFINTTEPYSFYGEDAKKILAIAREHQVSPEELAR